MNSKITLQTLVLFAVTSFVVFSQAEQRPSILSQFGTAARPASNLSQSLVHLPQILNNKDIDYKKDSYGTPGRFQVDKVHGPGSGGGGSVCAMGIIKVTKDMVQQGFGYYSRLNEEQEAQLLKTIQATKFLQGENLPLLRGEVKNAINFPELNIIVINSKGCEIITRGGTEGFSFLMHEYLGLIGVDDRDFSVSLPYSEHLDRAATGRDGDKLLFSKVIRNVTICAAECNSEVVGRRGHDEAYVGKIYYSSATEDNLSNQNVCMTDYKEVDVISDRMSDLSDNSCIAALSGKWDGKAVDIYTNELEDPNHGDSGTGLVIKPHSTKKKKK